MLSGLIPACHRQAGISPDGPDERLATLATVMDRVNARHGRDRIRLAGAGFDPNWHFKRQWLSPRFTTQWTEILSVR